MPELIEVHGHALYLTIILLLSYLHALAVTAIFADRSISKTSGGDSDDEAEDVDMIVVKVTHENLVYRQAGTASYCVWPDSNTCAALSNQSDSGAFIAADLRLCNIHYHQRLLVLEFSSNRYLLVRPLLHSSPNLYTRHEWDKKVSKVSSRDRGFKILVALAFGDKYVLSFNSNDGLAMVLWTHGVKALSTFPIFSPLCTSVQSRDFYVQYLQRVHPDSAEAFTDSYLVWLKHLAEWIRGCVSHPRVSIYRAIRDDQEVFDGCGAYMTCTLLACSGLRPWTAAIDVASCPARIARLAEAMFELSFRGHNSNMPRIRKGLGYNGVSLSATEDDILEYGPYLHVYGHNKYTVSIDMKRELDLLNQGQSADNDIFYAPFFASSGLPGHLGHLIRGTELQEVHDPVTRLFKTSCPFICIDKRTHATSEMLLSTKQRKVQVNVYAYQVGTGSKPPVAWTLYSEPPDEKQWRRLDAYKQDERTLVYVKRLTEKFLAGPLDFCGVSRVTKHGRGCHVWSVDPKSRSYRTHSSYRTSYGIAIEDVLPVYVQHREREVTRKKKLRNEKAKRIKLQQWEPGVYRHRSYTTKAMTGRVRAVRLKKSRPFENAPVSKTWISETRKTWKRISGDRVVLLQTL